MAQDLVINELLADNERGILDPMGGADDWIELVNTSGAALDLGATPFFLTDDPLDPSQYQLPEVVLAPGERLLVWADGQPEQGLDHAPFRLSAGGEDLQLIAGDGTTVLQSISFPAQRSDVSWSLLPDSDTAGGAFQFSVPTPLSLNDDNAPPHIVTVDQVPASPTDADVLVVRATVADDNDPSVTVDLMLTEVGVGTNTVPLLDDGLSDDGAAGDGAYGANLGMFSAGTQLEYWVRAEDTEAAAARLPAAAPVEQFEILVVSADCPTPTLFINEFMADNDTILADDQGQFDDWFEIWNPGTQAVSLLCLFVTDDLLDPVQYALPDVEVPAGGFVLVWADGDGVGLHANFSLARGGEEIGLFTVSGDEVDSVVYGAQISDASSGRFPDGGPVFTTFGVAAGSPNPITPASSNHQPVFADGFESGDTASWTASTP